MHSHENHEQHIRHLERTVEYMREQNEKARQRVQDLNRQRKFAQMAQYPVMQDIREQIRMQRDKNDLLEDAIDRPNAKRQRFQ